MTLHLSPRGRFSLRRKASSHPKRIFLRSCTMLLLAATLFSLACKVDERQSGIPSKAQESIDTFTEDFNSGRFDKIYAEAAEEWRTRVNPEQSNETFRTLKERLGAITGRTFTSGRQQQNPSANLPANSLTVRYNTTFERAQGMESFTLIERDGRFSLAGYSVSSDALKQ
jgi:hypothetical protein